MGDRERNQSQYDRERGRYDYRDESTYRGQNQPRASRDWDDYRRSESREFGSSNRDYDERQGMSWRDREDREYPRYSQDESRRYGSYTTGSSYDDPFGASRGYEAEGSSSAYGRGERDRDQSWNYGDRDRDRGSSIYNPQRYGSGLGGSTMRGGYGLGYGETNYGRNWGNTQEGNYRGAQRGREDDSFGQQLRDAGHQIARKVKRAFRGPKGYKRSDERVREDVNDRLAQQDDFDPSDIEVTVSNSEVTLTGTVQSRHEKFLAEEIADDVSGVNDVHNQLRVRRDAATTGTAAETATTNLGTQSGGTEAARNRNARA